VKNYVADGISANWRKLNVTAPRGMSLYYLSHLHPRFNLRVQVKYMVAYLAHVRVSGQRTIPFKTPFRSVLRVLCYLPGVICALKWRRDIMRQRIGNRLVSPI
jgi:hypothetical protein